MFTEHFTQVEQAVEVRPAEQLGSGSLQSPNDPEATYRKKAGWTSKGQVIHVAETCHPENQLNLPADVAAAPNNTDDAAILAERAETTSVKTPNLEELYVDGGYGSDDTDEATQEQEITLIQTAIKVRKPAVRMDISPTEEAWQVSCPRQSVAAQRTRKRWKAEFDLDICAGCPFANQRPATEGKTARRWYFSGEDAARKKLRPNVKATGSPEATGDGRRQVESARSFQDALLWGAASDWG